MSYFLPGLWHCGAAMAFAAAVGFIESGDSFERLRDVLFTLVLVVSSCAFFPIPDRLAKKGLWKFLHYPLPDWDVLLLGPASHRHWITHSAWLPVSLAALKYLRPESWPHSPAASSLALGACVGIGSHLFWDLAGSRSHAIVVVPHWWSLREAASRLWLLVGTALSLASALFFTDARWARDFLAVSIERWL